MLPGKQPNTQPNSQWESRIPHGPGGRDSSGNEPSSSPCGPGDDSRDKGIPGESLLLDHIRVVRPDATDLSFSTVVDLMVTVCSC